MARKKRISTRKGQRRDYPNEFKEEALQMLLDGHTAPSVVEWLGISNANMLYRWKKEQLARSGPVASTLEARVKELEGELRRARARARARARSVKKSVGYFRPQRIADVYAAIEIIVAEGCANVAQACRILDVNRPAFYAWKSSPPTVFEERDDELTPLIRVIFKKHRRRYGSRRIIKDLKKMGHVCSRRKVSNIMKTLHLKAIQPRSFVPKTTDSQHRLGYSPNLLLGADETVRLNQIWVEEAINRLREDLDVQA